MCLFWQRLYDERETRLRSVTASISRSYAQKTAPLRHTKLAYVNSVVKPPREVLRRQTKNRAEMQQRSLAVNGKRTSVAASLPSDTASPKKRHSTPSSVSPHSRSESPAQSKGSDISISVNISHDHRKVGNVGKLTEIENSMYTST